ncbi:MAG: 23S rRNA (uracil(1939)-C(5))-methyltransferase RlmD [Solobacterium sp.]|nr:23S rRNA (uracil(1939)-C(5))-methyltransferase RlmD [Solobacterium sp.]
MKTCPVRKKCGGCAYIDQEYETTLQHKQEYVQKLFGKIKVDEIKGMKDPYHYRHKIYASFYSDKTGKIHAGLYEENSHKLLNSTMCLIQHVRANDILKTICDLASSFKIEAYNEDTGRGVLRHCYLRVSRSEQTVMCVLVIGSKGLPSSKTFIKKLVEAHPEIQTVILNYNHEHTSMILGRRSDVVYGKGYITDRIGNLKFRISPQSFYQVNPEQTEVIYNTTLEMAQLKKNDLVFDVCCGIGTIALSAAPHCKHVIGVEINEQAIRDAERNMVLNGIENAEFHADDASHFIQKMKSKPDVVFLDPPRSGMEESFLRTLIRLSPKKIVYVSCNPETQIRDIRILAKAGYRVKQAVPVDNFPFTRHVESVVKLTRAGL